MSMLARYKKQGGILELVKLIESSPEPKRSSLLNMVRNEDSSFAAEVEARIFSFDKLKALPEGNVAEIVAATPPKFLALALHGENEDFIKLCEKCLGKNFAEFKSEKEALQGTTITTPQIETAQRKMISEARKLEASGRIKLGVGTVGAPVPGVPTSFGSPAPATAAAGAPTNANPGEVVDPLKAISSTQSSGGPYPPLETFGIDTTPTPGLMGERLENYFKQTMGF